MHYTNTTIKTELVSARLFKLINQTKMPLSTYWWAMKLISVCRGLLTSKISASGQPQNPKLQYGARYFRLELLARTSLKMSGKGL
jgi:hypothetical protein